MTAPSVSGITTIAPAAPTASILAAWGGFTVRAAGSYSVTSGYSQINDTSATLNQLVGGGTTFDSALNHAVRGRFLAIRYLSQASNGITTFSDSVIVLHSDLTGNNYRSFPLAESAGQLAQNLLKTINSGNGLSTKYADVGTFDPATVARIEFLYPKNNGSGTITQRYRFSLVEPITVIGGEPGNKANFQAIYNYALADANLSADSVVGLRNDVARQVAFSIQVGDGSSALDFEGLVQETIVFRPPWKPSVAIFDTWYPQNYIGVEFRTTTGNNFIVANKSFTSEIGYYVDFNGAGIGVGYNLNFNKAGDIDCNVPNATIIATFQNSGVVATNQGSYHFSISSADSVGLQPTVNTTFTGIIQRCPIGIEITAEGNYTNTIATVKNNTTYDVRITFAVTTGQTVNLDGIDFASGSTTPTNIYWAGTSGSITVTVNRGGLTTSSAGGTVNLVEPTAQIIVSGIPEVSNAIVAVENLSTSAITYPGIVDGEAIIPTSPGIDYKIMVDAPGYLRTSVVLDGATPEYIFELDSYRDIYDVGVSQAANISFDYGTFEVTISDGLSSYSFADVFRTIEDYLSTSLGVLFDFPPYPIIVDLGNGYTRQYLIFPWDTELDQANPVRVKPDPTNTTDPLLTDFVTVLEDSTNPLFDIFDFSSAGGRVIFFHSESVSVAGGGSGGDATLANQEAILSAIADVPTTTEFEARTLPAADYFDPETDPVAVGDKAGFSLAPDQSAVTIGTTTNLTNLPTIPLNWITAAGINADAIAEIQSGLSTFNPAITPVTAGTVTDKTGYSLVQSFPANFSSLLINASGHIGRVTLVDATTTNTDMRGTDNALLAANYTEPANSSIADILEDTGTTIPETLAGVDALIDSIKAKTDQLTFTIANQVDANALTGGGGDNAATIYSYFTALDREDAFKADVSELSTLTTADIPTAASIAGAVQTQLDDDFATLANILADIPDDVAAQTAIAAMLTRIIKIAKARGLEPGITASQLDPSDEAPGFLTTSDDVVDQTIVKNGDGSITISSN